MAVRDGSEVPGFTTSSGFTITVFAGSNISVGEADYTKGLFRGLAKVQRVMEVVKGKAFNVRVTMRHPTTGEGVTGVGGSFITQIAKAGATSLSTVVRTVTEIGSGLYNVAFTSADSDTPGPFSPVFSATGCVTVDNFDIKVVENGRDSYPQGAVVADGGNTILTFKTNLVQVTLDYWIDAFIVMTSGNYKDQVKKITGYDGTTKFISVEAPGFTGAPAGGDTFDIINR